MPAEWGEAGSAHTGERVLTSYVTGFGFVTTYFNFINLLEIPAFFSEKPHISEKSYLELFIKIAFCYNTNTHYTNGT